MTSLYTRAQRALRRPRLEDGRSLSSGWHTGEPRAASAVSGEAIKSDLRAEIAASAADTRRHFDVAADRLMDKIQLVGEDVIGVDQKVGRFRGEAADEFRRIDRRLLRLEARIIG